MGGPDAEVTVVIPTRNRVRLLAEAVASVLDQRCVAVRVTVVDDGSTDGTAGWLAEQADPRVGSIRLDRSRERTAARNAGLAEVTTPLVIFLDDDDLLAPDALRRLVGALERHPSAPVAAGTYATFGTYGPEEVPRQQPIGRFGVRRRMWREVLWGWYLLPGAGLWRTDVLRQIGGWDESRSFAEDLELSLRIHPHPVALVPHVVLRYRQHGRQVDQAVQAVQERVNGEVRAAFIARLGLRERRKAQRVVDARPTFAIGLRAYGEGDYPQALRSLASGLARVPALAVSPVLGPTLVGMVLKSLVAMAVSESWRRRVRAARVAGRGRRYGARAD